MLEFERMTVGDFEKFCVDLLVKTGYVNVKITSGSDVIGADILAEKDGINCAIRCMCHSSSIDDSVVHQISFYLREKFLNCHVGIVITNNYFTQSAKEAAQKTGVVLWDRAWLIDKSEGIFGESDNITYKTTLTIKPFRDYETDYPPLIHKSSDFFLGISANGSVVLENLDNAHHIFVKGTKSSGKTNFLHCLIGGILNIGSLLEDTRFILIDTKGEELNIYSTIPHLIMPVLTDVVKAEVALQWAVVEMDKRYNLYSKTGAQNIEEYNKIVYKSTEYDQLPRVIVVIDEIGDILNHYNKESYENISSLVRRGSRVGVHVVAATGSTACIELETLFPSVVEMKQFESQFLATVSITDRDSIELYIPHVEMKFLKWSLNSIAAVHKQK